MTELDMYTVVYMLGYADSFSVSKIAQTLDNDDTDIHTLWLIACDMHSRYECFGEQLDYIEMRMAEGEEE